MPSSSINDMNRSNLRNINYIENFVIDSNDNKFYKNISYVSFDSNQELSIKKKKIQNKKNPQIIYNRIQRSPIKKDYKVYSIQNTVTRDEESSKEENIINRNKNKNMYLSNINNNNSPPSPYTPYITKEDGIYQIIPQKAINIAFIQNNILHIIIK